MSEEKEQTTTAKEPRVFLLLDAGAIETRTANYPDTMRDATRWFAGFIRRRCSSNLGMLTAKTRKLGFGVDESNFSKILRGRWNTDADGKPIAPVLREKNFMQIVETLQREDALMDMACAVGFVETDSYKEIENYIKIRQSPERICKFGLIAGPTGAQKSASFKHTCRKDRSGNTHHSECPEKSNLGELLMDVAFMFGKARGGATTTKKREISDCVNDRTTLILDNVQRLYKPDDGWNQPLFSFLQKLQDEKNCCVIIALTLDSVDQMFKGKNRGFFEQFVGRCGGEHQFLIQPLFAPRTDILQFAEAFELRNAEKHIEYLEAISQLEGRIRVFLQALQEAKVEADGGPMTIEHVKTVMRGMDIKELRSKRAVKGVI